MFELEMALAAAAIAKVELKIYKAAVVEHHAQKADDRCWLDDDKLYAAFGLPPVNRKVGDKAAMLKNCERFLDRRCEGGGWATYAELETQLCDAVEVLRAVRKAYSDYVFLANKFEAGSVIVKVDDILRAHERTT